MKSVLVGCGGTEWGEESRGRSQRVEEEEDMAATAATTVKQWKRKRRWSRGKRWQRGQVRQTIDNNNNNNNTYIRRRTLSEKLCTNQREIIITIIIICN